MYTVSLKLCAYIKFIFYMTSNEIEEILEVMVIGIMPNNFLLVLSGNHIVHSYNAEALMR